MKKKPCYDLCIVISDLGAGGSQRVLINLLRAWQYKMRIAVVTVLGNSRNDFFELPPSVKRFSLPELKPASNFFQGVWGNFRRILSLRRILRKTKAKTILSFIGPTNVLAILASLGLNSRVVISERNDPARQSFGAAWDRLREILYRRADQVTANTRGALKTMSAYVPEKKLHWVPNPIQLTPSTEELHFSRPTILAVGRLHPQKSYDILLQAFVLFKQTHPEWRLAILGDGALREILQEMAKVLNIANSITWYGNVESTTDFYRAASLFVLASRHEGMPNALLEAMSCQLPVIITDASPGPLEYIIDDVSGLVVPVNDVAALGQAMTRLAGDKSLRERLAKEALTKVHYNTFDNAMKQWESALALDGKLAYEKG